MTKMFPNWLLLECRLRKASWAEQVSLVAGPIWEGLLRYPGARYPQFCFYLPDPQRWTFSVTFGEGIDLGPEAARADAFVRGNERVQPYLESIKAIPYNIIPLSMLGGESFLDLLENFQEIHTASTVRFVGQRESVSTNSLLLFALAGSILTLGALPLTDEEKEAILQADIRQLEEFTSIGPRSPAWKDSVRATSKAWSPFADCFSGWKIHWDRLDEFLIPNETEALREFERMFGSVGTGVKRSGFETYSTSHIELIARRLVHGIWLRVGIDNVKESVALGWLQGAQTNEVIKWNES